MAHIVVLQILIKNENICKVTYCVNMFSSKDVFIVDEIRTR